MGGTEIVLAVAVWYVIGFFIWQWVMFLRTKEPFNLSDPTTLREILMGFFGPILLIVLVADWINKYEL